MPGVPRALLLRGCLVPGGTHSESPGAWPLLPFSSLVHRRPEGAGRPKCLSEVPQRVLGFTPCLPDSKPSVRSTAPVARHRGITKLSNSPSLPF